MNKRSLNVIILAIVFVFAVIGTGIPQYTLNENTEKGSVSLWTWKKSDAAEYVDIDFSSYAENCDKLLSRFRAAQTFAILSDIFAFVAVLLAVLELKGKSPKPIAAPLATILVFISTLIVWSTSGSVYFGTFCNTLTVSLHDQNYEYGGGFVLFVVAWILSTISIVIGFMASSAPPEADDAESKTSATVLVILTFTILAGAVIATGTSAFFQIRYDQQVYLSLWEVSVVSETNINTRPAHLFFARCDAGKNLIATMGAFAIITDIFAFFAFSFAVLERYGTVVSQKATVNSLAIVFVTTLVVWSVAAYTFNTDFCGMDSLSAQDFDYGPSPAIFITIWILSLFAIVLANMNSAVAKPTFGKRMTINGFITLFGSAILIFVVIGTALSLYSRDEDGFAAEINLWSFTETQPTSQSQSISTYYTGCDEGNLRFQVMQAFAIISDVVAFIALIFAVLDLTDLAFSPNATTVAYGIVFAASLVVWSIAAAVYEATYCTAVWSFSDENYYYGPGFILYVTAWTLSIVVLLLNAIAKGTPADAAAKNNGPDAENPKE